jgi:hypothetical protein
MALVAGDLAVVQTVANKLVELQHEIRNSLSLQAVGGSHIANELTKALVKLEGIGAVVDRTHE